MEIVREVGHVCASNCPEGGHVLVIQDTSEVNYHHHNGRFKINDLHRRKRYNKVKLKDRVGTLEVVLGSFIVQTEKAIKELKKEEMTDFKEESHKGPQQKRPLYTKRI